jgi:hypothetical protein
MQISQGFVGGQRRRIYVNKIGEMFAVGRAPTNPQEGKIVSKQTSWSVSVKPRWNAALGLTGRIIGDREQKCLHIVEANTQGGKGQGRELFRAMIDECKQIGVKMFPHQDYGIYVNPAGKKLSKYYQDLGFKPVHFGNRLLVIKVKH